MTYTKVYEGADYQCFLQADDTNDTEQLRND